MKKLLLRLHIAIVILLLFITNAQSQTYLMGTPNITSCTGDFYDSGDAFGYYGAYENLVTVLQPDGAELNSKLSFEEILLNNEDTIYIYDGADIYAPLLAKISTSTPVPTDVVATNPEGKLTIQFISSYLPADGWWAIISCVSSGSSYLMPYNTNTSYTTCSGKFYDDGGDGGSITSVANDTVTFYPQTEGSDVALYFNYLDIGEDEYLTFYDGANTMASEIDTYYGYASDFSIVANNPSGAITVVFSSYSIWNYAGWDADISCQSPAPICPVAVYPGVNATISESNPTFAWTADPAAVSYTLLINNGATTDTIADITDTYYAGYTTSYYTNYAWQVLSKNGDDMYSSCSDNYFYTAYVAYVAPEAYTMHVENDNIDIQWTTTYNTTSTIEYSYDFGESWTVLDVVPASAGLNTYNWTITGAPENMSYLEFRIWDDNLGESTTSSYFYVNKQVVVLDSPLGGETFNAGTYINVKFETSDYDYYAYVEMSTDSGATYPNWNYTLVTEAGTDSISLWIPSDQTFSNKCMIRIYYSGYLNTPGFTDYTDSLFTVNALVKTIDAVWPDSGAYVYSYTGHYVQWTNNENISYVNLYASTDDGVSWNQFQYGVYSPEGLNSAYFYSGDGYTYTNARIKIEDYYDNTVYSISEPFTLSGSPQLQVNAPVYNETAIDSVNVQIFNKAKTTYDVGVYLYRPDFGFVFIKSIDSVVPGNNLFKLDLPDFDSNMEVYFYLNSPEVAYSQTFIALSGTSSVAFNSPHNGDMNTWGSDVAINFNTYTVAKAKIEVYNPLANEGSGGYETIADTFHCNNGTNMLTWHAAASTGTADGFKIKISDIDRPGYSFYSEQFVLTDPNFTIANPAPYATITAGETIDLEVNSVVYVPGAPVELKFGASIFNLGTVDVFEGNNHFNIVIPFYCDSSAQASISIGSIGAGNITQAITQPLNLLRAAKQVKILNPVSGLYIQTNKGYNYSIAGTGYTTADIYYKEHANDSLIYISYANLNQSEYGGTLYFPAVAAYTTDAYLVAIASDGDGSYRDSVQITLGNNNYIEFVSPVSTDNIKAGSNTTVSILNRYNFSFDFYLTMFFPGGQIDLGYYPLEPGLNDIETNIPINTIPSQAYLGLYYDGYNLSDTFNITAPDPTIQLVYPVSNNYFYNGDWRLVAWNSYSVNTATVSYSLDYGDWIPYADIASYDGMRNDYYMPIPDVGGHFQYARIKVEDKDHPEIFEVSPEFTMSNVPPITFVSPEGGSTVNAGSAIQVNFFNDAEWVDWGGTQLQASYDYGTTWTTIQNYDGGNPLYEGLNYFYWNIPSSAPATDGLVFRFMYWGNSWGQSTPVSIVPMPPGLTFTEPTANSYMLSSNPVTVTWDAVHVDAVLLYFRANYTDSWQFVDYVACNTDYPTSYNFYPDIEGTYPNCQFLITDADEGSLSAISPYFTISDEAPVNIIDPAAGAVIQAGNYYNVRFTNNAANYPFTTIYIRDNYDNYYNVGSLYPSKGENDYSIYVGPYFAADDKYKVVIYESIGNEENYTYSDDFTMLEAQPSINITAPVSGDVLLSNDYSNIYFSNINVPYVNIYYSLDNGTTWEIETEGYNSGYGYYNWKVPTTGGLNTNVQIKITSTDSAVVAYSSIFSISDEPRYIDFIYPVSSDVNQAGSYLYYGFNSTFANYTYYNTYISADGGANYTYIGYDYAMYGANYKSFYLNDSMPSSSQYIIKLVDYYSGEFLAQSEIFSVKGAAPQLWLNEPNYSSWWMYNKPNLVQWYSRNVDFLNISFSSDAGQTWRTLVNNVPSVFGINNYTLPDTLLNMSDASKYAVIKVTATDASIENTSQIFTVALQAPSINIVLPKTGDKYTAGQQIGVVVDNFGHGGYLDAYIKYAPDSNAVWQFADLNDHYLGEGRSLVYLKIPDDAPTTGSAQIQLVLYAYGQELADVSEPFSITALPPHIEVVTPGHNWVYYSNTTYLPVEWKSVHVNSVVVDYSIDSMQTWYRMDGEYESYDNTTNSVSTNFLIPDTFSQHSYFRVSDASNPAVYGISQQFTTSNNPDNFFIYSPNAGSTYTGGDNISIGFEYMGRYRNYGFDFYFSSDGGASKQYIGSQSVSWGYQTADFALPQDMLTTNNAAIIVESPAQEENNNAAINVMSDLFTVNELLPSISVLDPNYNSFWVAGNKYTISWNSVKVAGVNIELSTDGGLSWQPLAFNVRDTYSDSVVAPYVAARTENALVRLTSLNGMTVGYSNYFIIDNVPADLNIIQPYQGDVFAAGSYTTIVVDNSGAESYKPIMINLFDYKSGDNQNVQQIQYLAKGLNYIGVYIPETFKGSDSCAFIIAESIASANPLRDTSAMFSILPAPSKMYLFEPNYYSYYYSGSVANLMFYTINVDDVKIEFSKDAGLTWKTINGSFVCENGYNTFSWNVDSVNVEEPNCRIKITSNSDGALVSISDYFTISNVKPYFSIVTPNGGEELKAGNSSYIQFDYTGGITYNVSVWYSANDGFTWNALGSLPYVIRGRNYFLWNIPSYQEATSFYRIKLMVDSTSDISDGVFRVLPGEPALSINYPTLNDGYLLPNKYATISWNSSLVSEVNIDYSLDGGASWNSVIQNWSSYNGYNYFNWFVPNVAGTYENAVIRVVSNIDSTVTSYSNVMISDVPGTIDIVSPNAETVWKAGSYYTVDFLAKGMRTNQYGQIELLVNGMSYFLTNFWNFQNGFNSIGVTLPVAVQATDMAQIKINFAVAGSVDGSQGYYSDTFMIAPAEPSLTVADPAPYAYLVAGRTVPINWYATNVQSVNIELSTDNGNTWITIDSGVVSNNMVNTFNWEVPAISTETALIRLTSTDSLAVTAYSGVFTIFTGALSLDLLTPAGGEDFYVGSSYDLSFIYTGGYEQVKLYVSFDSITWQPIEIFYASPGINNFTRSIPFTASTGSNVRFKIEDPYGLVDISNPFKVNAAKPYVKVSEPHYGQMVMSGNTHEIRWSSYGVNAVDIAYSMDNGSTFTPIINNLPVYDNKGFYNWVVPEFTGIYDGIIKVSSSTDTLITGNSDWFVFSSKPVSITMNAPNGGEVIKSETYADISFNYFGTNNIALQTFISIDGGSTWKYLDSTFVAVPGDNVLKVYLPYYLESENCLIRVQQKNNPGLFDVSDAVFTVSPATKSLVISSPKNLNFWVSGVPVKIEWNSFNVAKATIEYSTDSAATWTTIATDVVSSNGKNSYNWTVAALSDFYKYSFVRITGAGIADTSDVFTLSNRYPATEARLLSLSVGGVLLDGFDNLDFGYTYSVPYSTSVPPAISGVAIDPNANVKVTNSTVVPGTSFIDVVAEDGISTKRYEVQFVKGSPSNDAYLSQILIDGTPLTGFASAKYNYNVELPEYALSIPVVSATATSMGAKLEFTQAASLTGTAHIVVIAENDSVRNTYNVKFSVKPFDVINNATFSKSENLPQGTVVGSLPVTNWTDSRPLTMSIINGDTGMVFAVSNAGVITIADSAKFNYEQKKLYVLTIKAVANDDMSKIDSVHVTVNVLNVNEKPVLKVSNFAVNENVAKTTLIGTLDPVDPEGDLVQYEIISRNDSNAFALSINGDITVNKPALLNFEHHESFTLTIVVMEAAGDMPLSDTATVVISVNDLNETPVMTDKAFTIDENPDNGTIVGNMAANEPDTYQKLTYTFAAGNDDGIFMLDSLGNIVIADSTLVNFEVNTSFTLTIKAQDNGPGKLSVFAQVDITVSDVNEKPVVAAHSYTLAENTINGTTVGTVGVTNQETSQTLIYSIISGNPGNAFNIGSGNGTITVLTASQLNHEVHPSFDLEIMVSDNGTPVESGTNFIHINITDVNEKPVIADMSLNVDEDATNGTVVGNVSASDEDVSQKLTYSITAGNTDGIFDIDTLGNIVVADNALLNFEMLKKYTLTVNVADNGTGNLSAFAVITVNINNVNEKPAITPVAFNVNENVANGTSLGLVEATNPEGGQTIVFTIDSGNTGGTFAINPNTGELSVAKNILLNHEVTGSFDLYISAQDNGAPAASDQVLVKVTVDDVNEMPFGSDQEFDVTENAPNGTEVGMAVVSDPDLGQLLTYTIISGNTDNIFAINDATGVITVDDNTNLNFELSSTYTLVVNAIDNGAGVLSTTIQVTVNVLNINEAPVVADANFDIAENSIMNSLVGQVDATDQDNSQNLSYAIVSGNDASIFAINAATGDITLAKPALLNFESQVSYPLVVEVTDDGTPQYSTQSNIMVSVTNANDKPVLADKNFDVDENTAIGTLIGTLSAQNEDAGETVAYSIIYSSSPGAFVIDGATGQLKVGDAAKLNYELAKSVSMKVMAQDNGVGKLSDTANIYININDIAEKAVTASFEYAADPDTKIVTFTDFSTGNVTDWYWTYGDGSSFSAPAASHTYSVQGKYTVCLTVVDSKQGASDKLCKEMQLGSPTCTLASDFAFEVSGDTVTLTNYAAGSIGSYYWNFGDFKNSTDANPVHVFDEAGFYLISLTVADSTFKCSDFSSGLIQVGSVACHAAFDFVVNIETKTAKFTNNSEGSNLLYYWDYDDGTFSVAAEGEHKYRKEGVYYVSLTVANKSATCMDNVVMPVQVGNTACSAAFTYYLDSATNTIFFQDKLSAESSNVLWSFGDGRASNEHNPSHEYKFQGYYNVNLTTYNKLSGCADSRDEVVLVGKEGIDCEAEFIYNIDPTTLEAQFTDNSVGDIDFYIWNFGDGIMDGVTHNAPKHKYNKPGYYNVCLTVINTKDIPNISCKDISVGNAEASSCKADFSYTFDADNKTVSFADASKGLLDKWEWNFGDNSVVNATQNPTHKFNTANYYLVSLKVSNTASKCSDKTYQLIPVNKVTDGLLAAFGHDADSTSTKAGGYPIDFVGAGLGDQARLRWSFGDGSTDTTSSSPSHVYDKPGEYQVCYIVSDPVTGQEDSVCQMVKTTGVGINDISSTDYTIAIYPNPLISTATIKYELPEQARVEISLFDFSGRKVTSLLNATRTAGTYELNWNGANLDNGSYILRLKTSNGTIINKMFIKQ